MKSIIIDPDGNADGFDFLLGGGAFDASTVVACTCPILPAGVWVGCIDDFGAQDLPLNRKAWALYGRSPIYGPMVLFRDDNASFSRSLLDLIRLPLDEWGIPDAALAVVLGSEPKRPEMLARREDQS